MYPYLHDFFNDIFGWNLQLPFPMFGFWVALAFLSAYYVFSRELKRMEGLGYLRPVQKKEIIGARLKTTDYLGNTILGFLIGFKGLEAFFNYEEFVNNPPGFIFSVDGSLFGAIIGAAIAYYLRFREGKKQELAEPKEEILTVHPYQQVGNMTMIAAIGGILGAKLFHHLEHFQELIQDPIGALFTSSGLSIFGGLIIGGVSVVIYARRVGLQPVIHVVDACAPALLLAYGVGRIGCQLSGDGDWGLPNDAPLPDWLSFLPQWMWAYDYPNNVLGVDLKTDFANMGLVSETGRAWPTPFYETVMAFTLFGLLWAIRKKLNKPGQVFSLYLLMIGLERLLIEQIRINPDYHFLGISATQAEVIAVILMIFGVAGLIWTRKLFPTSSTSSTTS